ncbi:MAG: TolC family protein [Elusimicrobia bacterium]|nr:TolC family protein [Elusimicrobiota bacterium]
MKFIYMFLLLALCVPSLGAMELSFSRAIEMIEAQSEDLQIAELNIERAQAGLSAIQGGRRPSLTLSASYMNLIDVERPGSTTVIDIPGFGGFEMPNNIGMAGASLAVPLYTFGRISNAAESARQAIEAAKSGTYLARREIRAAAAQIYWTARLTDEIVIITQRDLESSRNAQRHLERVGRAGRANLVRIQADIAAKEVALFDAQFNRDSAHRLLKVMAGIDENVNLILTDAFPNTFTPLNVPQTLETNPRWELLEAQISMHESAARGRRSERNPILVATASYNYMAAHTNARLWDGFDNQSANVGVALQIPLLDGGISRANARAETLAADALRQELQKSQRLMRNQYRDALLNHERLRGNLNNRLQARDLIARSVQMSQDRLFAGQTNAVELSDAQSSLLQMDMLLLNTKFNILMAEETVRKFIGN